VQSGIARGSPDAFTIAWNEVGTVRHADPSLAGFGFPQHGFTRVRFTNELETKLLVKPDQLWIGVQHIKADYPAVPIGQSAKVSQCYRPCRRVLALASDPIQPPAVVLGYPFASKPFDPTTPEQFFLPVCEANIKVTPRYLAFSIRSPNCCNSGYETAFGRCWRRCFCFC